MASLQTELIVTINEASHEVLERLLAVLERLATALERHAEQRPPGEDAGPYLNDESTYRKLEGNDE